MRYLYVVLIVFVSVSVFGQEASKDTVNPYDINVPITSDTGPGYGAGMQALSEEIASDGELNNLLKTSGISGNVEVAFRIQPNGKATDVKVLSGPDTNINKKVASLLKSKSFAAEVQNGIPTSCLVVVSVPVSAN